jgi:hypothetical protein
MDNKTGSNTTFQYILSGIAGALITGVLALRIQADNLALEKQKMEQQAKLEIQKREQDAEQERLRRLDQRIHDQKANVRDIRRQLGGQYWAIRLKNSCDKEVSVVLHYMALDDQWVTTGWWTMSPNSTAQPNDLDTRNPFLYYYAESGTLIWDGTNTGESGAIRREIGDLREAFYHIQEEFFPGRAREVAFRLRTIEGDYGFNPPLELSCR